MPQVNIRLSWLFTPTLILFCARLQERVSAICELRCDLIAIHRLAPPTKVSESLASAVIGEEDGTPLHRSLKSVPCKMQPTCNLKYLRFAKYPRPPLMHMCCLFRSTQV